MSENYKVTICTLAITFGIAAVLVSLIFGAFSYTMDSRRMTTIDTENLFKSCTQVDKHVDKYGGVVNYTCNQKGEVK